MLSTILTKSFSKDTALLILRVITGVVLIHHGFEKTANIENFADAFVRPLHLPFPIFLSWVAAISEIAAIQDKRIGNGKCSGLTNASAKFSILAVFSNP